MCWNFFQKWWISQNSGEPCYLDRDGKFACYNGDDTVIDSVHLMKKNLILPIRFVTLMGDPTIIRLIDFDESLKELLVVSADVAVLSFPRLGLSANQRLPGVPTLCNYSNKRPTNQDSAADKRPHYVYFPIEILKTNELSIGCWYLWMNNLGFFCRSS